LAVGPALPARGELRTFLRCRTSSAHEQLHLHPAFAPLASASGTRSAYVALMAGLAGFYQALDPLLERAAAEHGLPYVARARLIERDLDHLDATARPLAGRPAPPRGLPELLGMLYVVEGSTLGGSVLAARATELGGEQGAGFWSWCRREGTAHWKALTVAMDAARLADPERERAGDAASHLFDTLARHLDELPPVLAA
jgi:heme oxygenase (biliverdin-IX-beta and delta-forming)